jgi:hypothetical protein
MAGLGSLLLNDCALGERAPRTCCRLIIAHCLLAEV